MSLKTSDYYKTKSCWKIRIFDLIFSAILLIITSPLIILVAVIVSIDLGFPPLYISERVGKNNQKYYHLKFKSMKPGKTTGRIFFETERLSKLGKFLRNCHIDELPELLLIFMGKMSFVGPRPLPLQLQPVFMFNCRTSVKPGWTGLAQLKLIRTGKLTKKLQFKFDRYYIQHQSLTFNIKIILSTLITALNSVPLDLDPQGSEDRIKFQEKYIDDNQDH
ncbi:MAG: sugar transferase [bacterium]